MEKLKPPVDQAYDSPSWWYDLRGILILWFSYQSSLRQQIRFFAELKKDTYHLEAAIGSGSLFKIVLWIAWFRKTLPKSIVGFDYAPAMLAGAHANFKRWEIIKLLQADATALPFADETFDSTHLANAIHSIPKPEKAISELYRVLKPNGRLRINVLLPPSGFLNSLAMQINRWGIKKGILQGPIAVEVFEKLLADVGFQIDHQEIDGNCLYLCAVKARHGV